MLGEFLSANVSTPFLLFMVKGELLLTIMGLTILKSELGFGESTDEAEVAFWTGILG
jgi:hypothetical protein